MEVKALKRITDEAFELSKKVKKCDADKKLLNGELTVLKSHILSHLEENELDNFATKLCLAYTVTSESVKFPKEVTAKQKVFKYITKKYGKDALYGLLSINSAVFNTFYNKESGLALEKDAVKGLNFCIDGVDEPVAYTKLNLRKK